MLMIVYHRTSAESADLILRDGLQDARDKYMTDREFEGVWISDRPLDANEGVWGDVLLRIDLSGLTADDLADFEWVEDGKPHREWLVPADLLNRSGKVIVAENDP